MKRTRSDAEFFDSTLKVAQKLRRNIQRVARRNLRHGSDLHLSFFFFTKSVTSLAAMKLLWGRRFFQDSLILSRSIFETFLLDAYIRIDRTERVRRYLAYEPAARCDLAVGIIRSMKNRRKDWQKKWRTYASTHGRSAKGSPYAFDETRGWSGRSLREIVRSVEKKYRNKGIWTDYEFFYTLGSSVMHSSVLAIQEYMAEPHKTSYRKLGQPRPYFRELPMLACRWCLILGFLSAREHNVQAHDIPLAEACLDAIWLLDDLTSELEGKEECTLANLLLKS